MANTQTQQHTTTTFFFKMASNCFSILLFLSKLGKNWNFQNCVNNFKFVVVRELNVIFSSERTILETHADGTTLCPQLTALAATRLTFIAFFHHHGGGGRSFVCVVPFDHSLILPFSTFFLCPVRERERIFSAYLSASKTHCVWRLQVSQFQVKKKKRRRIFKEWREEEDSASFPERDQSRYLYTDTTWLLRERPRATRKRNKTYGSRWAVIFKCISREAAQMRPAKKKKVKFFSGRSADKIKPTAEKLNCVCVSWSPMALEFSAVIFWPPFIRFERKTLTHTEETTIRIQVLFLFFSNSQCIAQGTNEITIDAYPYLHYNELNNNNKDVFIFL